MSAASSTSLRLLVVDDEPGLREMLRIGIDGLYCDRPERMVATVAEFGTVRARRFD